MFLERGRSSQRRHRLLLLSWLGSKSCNERQFCFCFVFLPLLLFSVYSGSSLVISIAKTILPGVHLKRQTLLNIKLLNQQQKYDANCIQRLLNALSCSGLNCLFLFASLFYSPNKHFVQSDRQNLKDFRLNPQLLC